MTSDRLVCANCAGPVSEGRCGVCRNSRQYLEQQGMLGGVSPAALIALLVALLAVTLVVRQAVA
ncbi:hypothetical protein [Allostreptomyces psammosilenae]|uniref:Uncharacterized protein n=1 Tax=Allostreptomyces psammosilenae TaxID=1892865 RepID=A0A852ZVE7_9ACTN|nr:hypothetical protein [Allostreptomyces psammosilenae]NYI06209.1 hypothetical protein [Allostreptomyces psammosilenae]